MARVLDEAFAADEPVRRLLGLTRRRMIHFWRACARLYLALDEAICLGAYVDSRLAGAAVGWPGEFSPPLDLGWLFAWRYLTHLGPVALWKLGRFFVSFGRAAEPSKPCVRLINIGVDDAHRGQGLGAQLLAEFAVAVEERGVDRIQLECEEINPAMRLYQRSGYATERTFPAGGVTWHVMVRPLADAKE